MFAVLTEVRTWHSARSYCRLHGTDLASARNPAENEAVRLLIGRHRKTHSFFWIGLFRSGLRWSGGGYSSFTNWYSSQPNNDGSCILSNPWGRWYDRGCTYSTCFYCYGKNLMSTLWSFESYFSTTSTNGRHNFFCFVILQTTGNKSMKFIARLQFKSNSEFSPFSDSVLTGNILSKVSLCALRKFKGGLKIYH